MDFWNKIFDSMKIVDSMRVYCLNVTKIKLNQNKINKKERKKMKQQIIKE